jgi:hypothetical protein
MLCSRCGAENPDAHRFCGWCGAHRVDAVRAEAPARAAGAPPSVLFNAMLKSASSYITDMLVRGLDARRTFVTVGVFPGDLLLFDRIQSFAGGGQVAQQHFPASRENLAYLRKFAVPIVVHVRDLRAVMLSWTHHLSSAAGGMDELFWYYPAICPPDEFLGRPFEWRLDWCLEHHLPEFVAWLLGWCEAADRGDVSILFTRFEDFVADRAALFRSVLAHAGVPPELFRDPQSPPRESHLFRRGLVDEWRTVMDTRQTHLAERLIPEPLRRRFGWSP